MQIVVNIPDKTYKYFAQGLRFADDVEMAIVAIVDGTPLPKGHGAIKDISQIEIPMCEDRAYEKWVQVAINSAPTIVVADRSEEDG
jgi:hypothetical protein